MKKNGFRKGLVCVILVLFVGMSVVPSSGITIKNSESLETNKENEILGNRPPYVPSDPIPENGETDVPIDEIFLSWTGGDPDEDPWAFNVKYDVYFGESSPPPLVVEKQISLRYDPGIMDMYTTYYWQIIATDPQGESTTGPIWNFTTGSRTNRPPNAPEITAEKIGDNIFLIKIKLTDPDGDNLKAYAVCWDKNQFGFIYKGNWPNGTTIEEIRYYSRGTHQITASCFDRWGKWGDDGYLEIKVGKSQVQSSQQSSSIPSSQSVMNVIPSTGNMVFNNDTTPPVTTIYFDPPYPDGLNGWYVSDVTITLEATDDMSGVDVIKYLLDDSDWLTYTSPFTVESDAFHRITYYAVDKAGNVEQPSEVVRFNIDQTPPTIELTWDEENKRLVADVYDETSGIAKVEFYVNDEYLGEVTDPPYEFIVPNPKPGDRGQVIVYDNAGNSASVILDDSDIYSNSQSSSYQQSSNPLFFKILGRLLGYQWNSYRPM